MIQVTDLTVRFGGVSPIRDLTVAFGDGTCGLIGPNGAGKTTFFNVLSGFVAPAAGRVHVDGRDLLALAPHQRARRGLRRTFQTEQAIEELSVLDNVLLVAERCAPRARRAARVRAARAALEFVGLDRDPRARVAALPARDRRLLEVARAVVGAPRLVLLDEPAAGLPDDDTAHLAAVIRRIPRETGALVILVDHDMGLVSECCEHAAVLDFGQLIAEGPTAEVLRDPHVIRAYLGTEEER